MKLNQHNSREFMKMVAGAVASAGMPAAVAADIKPTDGAELTYSSSPSTSTSSIASSSSSCSMDIWGEKLYGGEKVLFSSTIIGNQ